MRLLFTAVLSNALASIAITGIAFADTDAVISAMLARDKSLELDTRYEPVPGDPRVYYAAGFAQVMCSAVFITKLPLDFARENVGYFTAPYAERQKLGAPAVDYAEHTISVAVPSGPVRTARYVGSQGCVTYPLGEQRLHFRPQHVAPSLPHRPTRPTGRWATACQPPRLRLASMQRRWRRPSTPPSAMATA
jgi:hypothetical protein